MICRPFSRGMNPRSTPAIIAISPKPVPPVVTISPLMSLLRSRASPVCGCAKSTKYFRVYFCTISSSTESHAAGTSAFTSKAEALSTGKPDGHTLYVYSLDLSDFPIEKSMYSPPLTCAQRMNFPDLSALYISYVEPTFSLQVKCTCAGYPSAEKFHGTLTLPILALCCSPPTHENIVTSVTRATKSRFILFLF